MSKYHEESFCDTCAYKGVDETEEPCKSCCNCYENKYVQGVCELCIHNQVCAERKESGSTSGHWCKHFMRVIWGGRK